MVDLSEQENVLVLIHERKLKILYDAFGLLCFLSLGLVLINSSHFFILTDDELASGWFTASVGSLFCLLMILTNQHTTKWKFDRTSSSFTVEYKGILGSKRSQFLLSEIESVKIAYLNSENASISIIGESFNRVSVSNVPRAKVEAYTSTIKKFLNLDSTS
jgi:hypothetical protein